PVFGPSAEAARIEGSKAFAKDVMAAAGVRTARAEVVDSPALLDEALDRFGPTWVVKDDGLAAGKGVVVTPARAAARATALPSLGAAGGHGRADRRRGVRAGRTRDGGAGLRVLGPAVRGARDHVVGTRGGGVQLPLRRPRDAGGAGPARVAAGRDAARRGHGP